MDASRLQVKVFVDGDLPVALDAFIPVFHRWIKDHAIDDVLVDVANYTHVPKGPGVALIGHGSDYYIDSAAGRPGLLYSRKRGAPPPEERLRDAFRRACVASLLLEKEGAFAGKLRFRSDGFWFRINDRLLAPQGDVTFQAVRHELAAFCDLLFGTGAYQLEHLCSPKDLFSVHIVAPGAPELARLCERLGGPYG